MRLALCLVGLAGCAERTLMQQDVVQDKAITFDIPAPSPAKVDILFVIDNSPAMRAHQANLTANFRRFIDVLDTLNGGLPDVHIGVITSDLGTRGASDARSDASVGACIGEGDGGVLRHSSSAGAAFLSDRPQWGGTRERNYTGELADAFFELANVGSNGCPFAQPLGAVQAALDHNPANAGFVRADANLAIVFITAQDDCTFEHASFLDGATTDTFRCTANGITCSDPDTCRPADSAVMPGVVRYASFLKGLKADPDDVMVGVLAGPATPVTIGQDSTGLPILDPSCTYEQSSAAPAVRLAAFADQFPNRSRTTTICQHDLEQGLVLSSCVIGGTDGGERSRCMDTDLLDTDPDSLGIQPDCAVADVLHPSTAPLQEVLPACDATASNLPCWHVVRDDQQCFFSTQHLAMKVERADFPPPDTHVIGSCVTR